MSDERPQLDLLSTHEVVGLLLAAEERVLPAVRARTAQIANAADLVAERMRQGGRLLLAGAGTSGRLAFAEAAELPGTFGLPRALVRSVIAGGTEGTDRDEDDASAADADLAMLGITKADVLVAVAASGRTPYTLAIASAARTAGAAVVALVNATATPLAALSDVVIDLDPAPEVLRDSTRLTAGTGQKIALNALTTAAMVRLGRVHADLMIDVVGDNAKLRERRVGIVAEIAGCSARTASAALEACGDSTRAAVLHLVLGLPPSEAVARAARFITLRDSLGQGS